MVGFGWLDFVGVLLFSDVKWVVERHIGFCGCLGVMVAISSNRTLEYAEEFFHIDVLVAVLTFYLKMMMMLISFYL